MNRRHFLSGTLAAAAGSAVLRAPALAGAEAAKVEQVDGIVKISKTPDEWRKILTPVQFSVLREEGTERPFTSPLNNEKRNGTYVCAGCDLPLFESRTKFDSGTGWPSFYAVIPGRVETTARPQAHPSASEYHCARCGGHHGHVFDDGPEADRAALLQQRRRS